MSKKKQKEVRRLKLRFSKDFQQHRRLRAQCFKAKNDKRRFDDFDKKGRSVYLGLWDDEKLIASVRVTLTPSVIQADAGDVPVVPLSAELARGCVDEKWRQNGLMHYLIVKAVEYAFRKGCTYCYAMHTLGAPHEDMLVACGFKVIGRPVVTREGLEAIVRRVEMTQQYETIRSARTDARSKLQANQIVIQAPKVLSDI